MQLEPLWLFPVYDTVNEHILVLQIKQNICDQNIYFLN